MPANDTNTTITFRLPLDLYHEVVRLAEASGVTKHQLARTLIVRSLEPDARPAGETDLSGVEEAFQLLQESLADFRTAMGRGIGAILQETNPKRDKEEIRRWVFERIIKNLSAGPDVEGGDSQ